MALYYRHNVEETPEDDVASLLPVDAARELKGNMLDISVFQGTRILWISAWRSSAALRKFLKAIPRIENDSLVQVKVERDYTKFDRNDAPSQTPGETSKL